MSQSQNHNVNTHSVKWDSSSGTQVKICPEGDSLISSNLQFTGSSSSSTTSSADDECGEFTAVGSPCELSPSFDDGRCHWHTSEQCYRPTDDGTPCEKPGTEADGACSEHTRGCNESKAHSGVQKAAFHSIKGAYRWLGLHEDMPSRFNTQPEPAAIIAAQAGRAYLQVVGKEYDRERSLEDLKERHMKEDAEGFVEKLIEFLGAGFETADESRHLTTGELKDALSRSWEKIDNGSHKAGARVAVAAGEAFLGYQVEVDA